MVPFCCCCLFTSLSTFSLLLSASKDRFDLERIFDSTKVLKVLNLPSVPVAPTDFFLEVPDMLEQRLTGWKSDDKSLPSPFEVNWDFLPEKFEIAMNS